MTTSPTEATRYSLTIHYDLPDGFPPSSFREEAVTMIIPPSHPLLEMLDQHTSPDPFYPGHIQDLVGGFGYDYTNPAPGANGSPEVNFFPSGFGPLSPLLTPTHESSNDSDALPNHETNIDLKLDPFGWLTSSPQTTTPLPSGEHGMAPSTTPVSQVHPTKKPWASRWEGLPAFHMKLRSRSKRRRNPYYVQS